MKRKRKKIREKIKEIEKEVKKEFSFNVPNLITFLRVILTFLFVFALFWSSSKILLIIIFGIAAASDWFDGYFARKLNQTTKVGARMDQVIDRVFTVIVFGSLLIYYVKNPSANHPVVLLFLTISREIVGLPGFLINIIMNRDPYRVRYIGKFTTFVQSITFGLIILEVNWAVYPVMITCISGIISGIDYLKYSLSGEQ